MLRRFIALVAVAALAVACSSGHQRRQTAQSQAHTAARSDRPSPDPYIASVRYANCMRAHGVPHPLPDKRGDFHLTAADERRIRRVPRSVRKAADDACFHHLRGLNLSPLSKNAITRATKVVASLGRCIEGHGYSVGTPEVRNLGRGRASFGFAPTPDSYTPSTRRDRERYTTVEHRCERQVHFAERLSKIIAQDRKDTAKNNT